MKKIVVPMAAALLASPHAAAFRTEISAIDDAGGAERVFCPSGTAILGGGFDPSYPSGMVGHAFAPLEPVGLLNGSFTVSLSDLEAPQDAFRAAAICGHLPELSLVEDSFSVPAGGTGAGSVQCPVGQVAVSGGAGAELGGLASEGLIATSAPYFPSEILDPDLTDRDEGPNPAPGGWKAARTSLGPAVGGEVFAVCASPANVVTMVTDWMAPAASTVYGLAGCPSGHFALGGGADAVDRSGLRVASNGPTFSGSLLGTALFSMSEGSTGPPRGWMVAMRNESGATRAFKVAAVCVPEAPGSAAAIA